MLERISQREVNIMTHAAATAAAVGVIGVGIGTHVCTQLHVRSRRGHRGTTLEARPRTEEGLGRTDQRLKEREVGCTPQGASEGSLNSNNSP